MKKSTKWVGYILAVLFGFGLFDKSAEAGATWFSALLIAYFLGRIARALESR